MGDADGNERLARDGHAGTYYRLRAARALVAVDHARGVAVLCDLIADPTLEHDENETRPRTRVVDALVSAGERQAAETALRAAFDDRRLPAAARCDCAVELARLGAGVAALLAFCRESTRHATWAAFDLARHGRRAEAAEFLRAAATDPARTDRERREATRMLTLRPVRD